MNFEKYRISEKQDVSLDDYETKQISDAEDEKVKDYLYEELVPKFQDLHNKMLAQGEKGILVILQALDAAGKDEIISYIFSTLSPQGLKVTSFGKPSEKEEDHDYLWRMREGFPARGEIGILNRSYYEEILAPKIYDILGKSPLPDSLIGNDIWEKRYNHLRNFEHYMFDNGFPVVKFYFHLSKETQKERLLERMTTPEKNHEFSMSDLEDRQHWDEYREVFEEMLSNTGSEEGPWYVLPADNPWLSRSIATEAMIHIMEQMKLSYPTFDDETQEKVDEAIEKLENDEI